jgi:tRNA (cmo5U34)-methyltransferase
VFLKAGKADATTTISRRETKGVGEQFHFDPDTYMEMVLAEVPAYRELQREIARATAGPDVRRILDLGAGTGETAEAVLAVHPTAELVGIEESPAMLEHARRRLPGADLLVSRLEDPLPEGPFDLVVSALAIHHLDGPGKADLFSRVAAVLGPGGRAVIGDVVVPDDPDDVVTPVDGVYDQPSRIQDQLLWLEDAGLVARVAWRDRDLAVLVVDRPESV